MSVERTGEYRGLYHVLGGALSPLDGVEPADLRIDGLLARVAANGVTEVVLATNPTMTGEATAAYLADRLRDTVRVTRLASGLPVGGDLEYADEVTLGRALVGQTGDVAAMIFCRKLRLSRIRGGCIRRSAVIGCTH